MLLPFDGHISRAACYDRRAPANQPISDCFAQIKMFGKPGVLVFLALLAGAMGRKRLPFQIMVALLMVFVLTCPLKSIVGRQRPRNTSTNSFPSGDAALTASFVVPILVRVPMATPLGAVAVLAVGAGRIAQGYHYPSDVFAGIALGLIAGAMAMRLVRRPPSWARDRHFALALLLFALASGIAVAIGESGKDIPRFFAQFGVLVGVLLAYRGIRAVGHRVTRRRSLQVQPAAARSRAA